MYASTSILIGQVKKILIRPKWRSFLILLIAAFAPTLASSESAYLSNRRVGATSIDVGCKASSFESHSHWHDRVRARVPFARHLQAVASTVKQKQKGVIFRCSRRFSNCAQLC